MFENLISKLSTIVNSFVGKYKLSDSNIKDILKKFRKSLLDADVSWNVVKSIINNVRNKVIDLEISRQISPGNMVLKVINDEFMNIMNASSNKNFNLCKNTGLNIILLVGLQGVGKTTSVVKLAKWIEKKHKKKSAVVSCDIYRPAAIEQLKLFSDKASILCYNDYSTIDTPSSIVKNAIYNANVNKCDFLIIDSAGRLHIDEFMMNEIKEIYDLSSPSDVFLVVDSMIGQDAVNSALTFCDKLNISGFILTKLDGDSRGGVLLSLSYVTSKPIRFLGIGETVSDFEIFYPERLISRILGMGDISSLVEEVNEKINESESKLFVERILNDDGFSLDDFKIQLKQMLNLGGIKNILDKVPGGHQYTTSISNKIDDKYFSKMIAIINSMTLKERFFPNLINGSRKKRIALGSGTTIQCVNKLLKQYGTMKKMLQKCSGKDDMVNILQKKFPFFNNK